MKKILFVIAIFIVSCSTLLLNASEISQITTESSVIEEQASIDTKSSCSAPWWSTSGNYNNKDWIVDIKCHSNYTFVSYLQGFTYGDTPNGGDTNRAKLRTDKVREGGFRCGYAQVLQPDGDQFDGSKVCSETGQYHYSYASAGAQKGTDYNSFITSSS